MSLFRRRAAWAPVAGTTIPAPGAAPVAGSVRVSNDTAMRHSAVWAALRLRANLVSTMPVDVYREVNGVRVEVPKPPVLVNPGGERVGIQEWLYSTQVDLDRSGNAFGLITARDGAGLPARIDLVELGSVGLVEQAGEIVYRIDGKTYPARDVWHERQYTISGLAVGLSPVAYAAWSIGSYLSAQHFALDWFGNSAIPAAELRNTMKETLTPPEAQAVKERYRATVRAGDVFVHGRDWELKPIQAVAAQTDYIELMRYGIPDIARFFDVPADLIDGAIPDSSITYANITERNLQLLVMHLGPAVARRESALSTLTAPPRYVKLNRAALLAMDPVTQAKMLAVQLDSRQVTPTEARALLDRAPLTAADLAEIEAVYGPPRTQPKGATS